MFREATDGDRPIRAQDATTKSLGVIKGLRRHVSDKDEDVIVLKLLEELDVAGYEIVKKPGAAAGFTCDTPNGDDAA